MRRFQLDHKHQRKSICPACGKRNTYTMWYDTIRGVYMPETFGVCDRENHCTYFNSPYSIENRAWITDYLRNNTTAYDRHLMTERIRYEKFSKKPQPNYLPTDWVNISCQRGDNTLSIYLKNLFLNEFDKIVDDAMSKYYVGTSNDGQPVFFEIDNRCNVRTGKIISYNPDGHRDKSVRPKWLHKFYDSYNLVQVPFGTHLPMDKRTAVVESEKTAVIMSIFVNELRWIATGGSNGINPATLPIKDVILVPDDDDAGDKWFEIARKNGYQIFDNWKQEIPREVIHTGWDIADFAIWFYLSNR